MCNYSSILQGEKMTKSRLLSISVTCIFLFAGHGMAKSYKKYSLGDIPLPKKVYQKYLKHSALDTAEVLPSSYDARDYDLVTVAKDQGSCGSCWAFASVGAFESHLLKAYALGPEDLSEQQQISCNTGMYGCLGGSSSAIRYWESKGPEDETYFPYTESDATMCKEATNEQLAYQVTNWHTVPTTPSDFKNSLYTDGPSYWRYDVYSDFYTYWNTGQAGEVYVNSGGSYSGGHAVLLIGWDDSKGAYLCKNSWGETGGPNGDGTFWIAYTGHSNDLRFGMANFSLTHIPEGCSTDLECDDGIFCNGQETCVNSTCQAGVPINCPDDGFFCNGAEFCSEGVQQCSSTGDPCATNSTCNEDIDQCIAAFSCGNGICEAGENCSTCASDCISGPLGGTCGACFKGSCDGTCHPKKEDLSCSDCWATYCCGDGICEGAENTVNCAVDCQ
jgi:hypothetical protein